MLSLKENKFVIWSSHVETVSENSLILTRVSINHIGQLKCLKSRFRAVLINKLEKSNRILESSSEFLKKIIIKTYGPSLKSTFECNHYGVKGIINNVNKSVLNG